jgi:hypothetical protein
MVAMIEANTNSGGRQVSAKGVVSWLARLPVLRGNINIFRHFSFSFQLVFSPTGKKAITFEVLQIISRMSIFGSSCFSLHLLKQ